MKPISRKDFLIKTGAGITGIALSNPISSVFGQSSNELTRKITRKGRKVRVALVGTGGRGLQPGGRI